MWSIFFGLVKNFRRATSKHPNFPTRVANPHTTYLTMRQNVEHFRKLNDCGRETISSVINEEVSEMLCEIYKKRWRRAEKEWFDVAVVLLRTYLVIRKKKKERYNEIVSRIRFKRMLEVKRYEQTMLFSGCDTCLHRIPIAGVGNGICSIGHTGYDSCPIAAIDLMQKREMENGI